VDNRGVKRKYDYTDADIEHAAVYGISQRLLSKRLERGFPKGEAISRTPKRGQAEKETWKVKGLVITKEQTALARKNNLDHQIVRSRIISGMTVERAITTPRRKGIVTKQEVAEALAKGINYSTYYSRRDYGWSHEEAITRPVDKNKNPKKPKTQKEPKFSKAEKESKNFKFKAEVPFGKKTMVIGYYKTEEEAKAAEKQALETLYADV
jgi:hypothetical protein